MSRKWLELRRIYHVSHEGVLNEVTIQYSPNTVFIIDYNTNFVNNNEAQMEGDVDN